MFLLFFDSLVVQRNGVCKEIYIYICMHVSQRYRFVVVVRSHSFVSYPENKHFGEKRLSSGTTTYPCIEIVRKVGRIERDVVIFIVSFVFVCLFAKIKE